MSNVRLLLISRDDLLGLMNGDVAERAFRLIASLTRQGYHLLATAPQPEEWTGEHGSPDDALLGPSGVRKRLSEAGGNLDGIYYVRRSLLTQKRNREDALRDILQRYAAKPEQAVLRAYPQKPCPVLEQAFDSQVFEALFLTVVAKAVSLRHQGAR